MGGWGSGRWNYYEKKTTVEQCLVLAPRNFSERSVRSFTWSNTRTGDVVAYCRYELHPAEEDIEPWVRMYYTRPPQEQAGMDIGLTSTPLTWGGSRWWFNCPLHCGRRVGKLYLPPEERHFGCRHCHKLTYKICQEEHQIDTMSRYMSRITGCTQEQSRQVLLYARHKNR